MIRALTRLIAATVALLVTLGVVAWLLINLPPIAFAVLLLVALMALATWAAAHSYAQHKQYPRK